MTGLECGDKAPDFSLLTDGKKEISLQSLKGCPVILYFYPKDDTPGCTAESCDFRDNMRAFDKIGAQVVGISKDSVARHEKFKAKYGLSFPLASDEDGKVCLLYGVWIEKSMYGKKYMGIDRSTFLIDEKGIIRNIWRKVKVSGHVDEVLKALSIVAKAA